MKQVKVKDFPNLVKVGPAVLNTDRREYENALLRQAKLKRDRELESRVNALESKLDTIIELLRKR